MQDFQRLEDGRPVEIGIFMPSAEVVSNRTINCLASRIMQETQCSLTLFLTKQPKDGRVEDVEALRKKRFLHHTLLDEVIFPWQRENHACLADHILLAPDLLADKFNAQAQLSGGTPRIKIVEVANPNDPKWVQTHVVDNEALKLCFSVRNLVLFKDSIISAFLEHKGEASLVNLHPAPTNEIRGLEGPFWTRFYGHSEYCTTMHAVDDEGIDTGRIIDYVSTPLNGNASRPVVSYMRDVAPEVANMIFKQVHLRFVRHGESGGFQLQPNEGGGRYCTLPTQAQVKKAEKMGIVLVDHFETGNYLLRHYAREEGYSEGFSVLRSALERATEQFLRGNYRKPKISSLKVDVPDNQHHAAI